MDDDHTQMMYQMGDRQSTGQLWHKEIPVFGSRVGICWESYKQHVSVGIILCTALLSYLLHGIDYTHYVIVGPFFHLTVSSHAYGLRSLIIEDRFWVDDLEWIVINFTNTFCAFIRLRIVSPLYLSIILRNMKYNLQ